MRWQVWALWTVGVALWIDASFGGDLAGNAVCLAVVAGLALVAGWRSRLPELVLAGVLVAGLLTVANQVASPGEFSFANDGVFYAVVVLAPGLVGWLLSTRSRQLGEVRQHTAELQRRRAVALAAVRAAEAERVERQIDLVLAARIDDIILGVRNADGLALSDPGAVPARLAQVEVTARAALSELRTILGVLHVGEGSQPASGPMEGAAVSPQPVPGRRWDRFDVLLLLAAVPLAVETSHVAHRGSVWLTVAVSLGQGLLLCVVRRQPLVGAVSLYGLASAQSAWLTPLPPTVSWMLPGLLVPFLTGAAQPRRTARVALMVTLLGFGAVTLLTPAANRALDGIAPSMVMMVLAWWAGRSLAVREARASELHLVLGELARTCDEQVRLAASEQRADMARDLHDIGAHALTVVCLLSGAAQKLWDSDQEQARTALTAVRELADDSLSHIGKSLGGLVAQDSEQPLDPAALTVLAGLGKVLGLDVAIEVRGEPRELDGMVARAAFRVVQESLTNAARHAAYATVRIDLAYTSDTLEVRVSDSGPGPVPSTAPVAVYGSGLGLQGMRERVEACHGQLTCDRSGAGFAIFARLPYSQSLLQAVL